MLGSLLGYGAGGITAVNVTTDKEVRCIDTWYDLNLDPSNIYTKCIRIGKGWSPVNEATGFEIRNRTESRQDLGGDNDLLVKIYFTDKVTYFNETTDFGSGLGACARESSYRDCDWDAIFSTSLPYNLSRISTNSLVAEVNFRNVDGEEARWVDLTSYLLWADYQLRLSPFAAPVVNTANTSVPDANTSTPVVIHPNWVLAAWSVNSTGAINGTSTLGSMFASIVSRDFNPRSDNIGVLELSAVLFLTMAHALSLIPYNSTSMRLTPHAALERDGIYFSYWRSRRVWMYTLGSRTSMIGVVVIIIGMVVVVMRTLLALYEKFWHNYATRALSPTELVVATLSHQYENEFEHSADKSASAQVRYRIEDEGGVLKFRVGRVKF